MFSGRALCHPLQFCQCNEKSLQEVQEVTANTSEKVKSMSWNNASKVTGACSW